jgi:hypothetical protein
MNTPNQLDQAIEALRQEHRSIQPPASLEAAIHERARLEQRSSAYKSALPLYAWSLAAAAIAIAVILLHPRPTRPTIETHIPSPQPPSKSLQTPPPLNAAVQLAPYRSHPKRRPTSHQAPPGQFIPLPNGIGLPEPTQAMLIRTRIDTSSLRSYGLTPPPLGAPQTILAEFLVGEDGLPRAIRLVP